MSALKELDNVIDQFGHNMDKDSISSDKATSALSNDHIKTTKPEAMTYEQDEEKEEEKEIFFDITNFECMSCEQPLLPDFKQWMEFKHTNNKKIKESQRLLHLKLLNNHPFVKQSKQASFDYPKHSFNVIKYALNCRQFGKWCKTVKQSHCNLSNPNSPQHKQNSTNDGNREQVATWSQTMGCTQFR